LGSFAMRLKGFSYTSKFDAVEVSS
jgi:hypothetical protein